MEAVEAVEVVEVVVEEGRGGLWALSACGVSASVLSAYEGWTKARRSRLRSEKRSPNAACSCLARPNHLD